MKKQISKLDDETLFLKFKSYESLNNKNKIVLLQELENREAIKANRKRCVIEPELDTDNYGSFSNIERKIYIDVNQDKYRVLDTYFHESKHAIQFDNIKNGKALDTKDLIIKCELAEGENGNLYNYEIGQYETLFSEIDANQHATNRMLEYSDLYLDDYEYQQYMTERMKYYESLDNEIHNNDHKITIDVHTKASRSVELINDSEFSEIEKKLPNEKLNIRRNSQDIGNRLKKELYKSNEVISKKQNEMLMKGVQGKMNKFNDYQRIQREKIDKIAQEGGLTGKMKRYQEEKKFQEEMERMKVEQEKSDEIKRKMTGESDNSNDKKSLRNKRNKNNSNS